MNTQLVAQLKLAIQMFDEAEAAIKKVEGLCGDITVPSINELRYFGYHICKAIISDSDAAQVRIANEAIKHCKRALFDAHEAGLSYTLESIRQFQSDYAQTSVVPSVVPDIATLYAMADDAVCMLNSAPREDGREDYYQQCRTHYDAIEGVHKKLKHARPMINKAAERERKTEKRETWILFFAALAAVITAWSFFG